MAKRRISAPVKLFYSYSHGDADQREQMEKSLSLLREQGYLQEWCDEAILPGERLSKEIRDEMDQADIIAFLLSRSFIDSVECRKEWNYAKRLADHGKRLFLIPIILSDCPWLDFLGDDDFKALPKDGKAINRYRTKDTAWLEVYEGIKLVVNEVRQTFAPNPEFLEEKGIEKTDFISDEYIALKELFVFLRMTCISPEEAASTSPRVISSREQLMDINHVLVHGQEKSGKTALARHLYLSLIEEAKPVLLLDSTELSRRPNENFIRNAYHAQFSGDYHLWKQQGDKTLILDNMTTTARSLELIGNAKDIFDRIIVTVSSDVFYSYYMDEPRIADFQVMKLEPLTRSQQEELIRKRLSLADIGQPITDGLVDQIETDVNSVILSDRIVPRYPFYVLAILQSREKYMPDFSITSYGHCYFVLIMASLIQAGIPEDKQVNTCFNFAEHLAFAIYQHRAKIPTTLFDFSSFVLKYKDKFYIEQSIIGRLMDSQNGIIGRDGSFRTEYMYYYFLGKFLAGNNALGKSVIEEMRSNSHVFSNYLTILFTIHHSRDNELIDHILEGTISALEATPSATLVPEETERFRSIVEELPDNILSEASVEESREMQRDLQDEFNGDDFDASITTPDSVKQPRAIAIHRILKNNKIMGQVLRNMHGNLEKNKIQEIIATIADSGLRLVNLILKDEKEIIRYARFVASKTPDLQVSEARLILESLSFLWTMINLEQIVETINVPEVREAIDAIVEKSGTPAYDLIGYFSQLDSATQLSERERNRLNYLLNKHDDVFISRIVAIRTQLYMNTHRSPAPIQQSMCARLGIQYFPGGLAGQ